MEAIPALPFDSVRTFFESEGRMRRLQPVPAENFA
jgi:hypothetical protein